jgi:hypothetical protein
MKRSLDISFVGSSLVSAYWNGAEAFDEALLVQHEPPVEVSS